MIQILHLITGKRCFVKERGIHSGRPMVILVPLSLEVMSGSSVNADLAGAQDGTRWYLYTAKSIYWIT
jgi:hypothetical protein